MNDRHDRDRDIRGWDRDDRYHREGRSQDYSGQQRQQDWGQDWSGSQHDDRYRSERDQRRGYGSGETRDFQGSRGSAGGGSSYGGGYGQGSYGSSYGSGAGESGGYFLPGDYGSGARAFGGAGSNSSQQYYAGERQPMGGGSRGYGAGQAGGPDDTRQSYARDYRGWAERAYQGGFGHSGFGNGNSSSGNDRGFLEKAGDEVMSWFGDDDAARRREQDHAGKGPSGYTRSDERIREDANDRLTDDWRVDASHVNVAVEGGEVTLSGTVSSRDEKRRAEDCVERISGVKHVQNNLRVQQREASSGQNRSSWGSGSTGSQASTTSGMNNEVATGSASGIGSSTTSSTKA